MTNDVPMTKEVPMMNDEKARARLFVLRASPLIRHSSFELRQFPYAPRVRDTSGRLRSLLKISSRGASLI